LNWIEYFLITAMLRLLIKSEIRQAVRNIHDSQQENKIVKKNQFKELNKKKNYSGVKTKKYNFL
jgi:hypothetical protein